MNDLDLLRSNCDSYDFAGLDLKKQVIEGISFYNCTFENCNFSLSDFTRSTFKETNLRCANFINACNYCIDFSYNSIEGAKFSLPEAISLLNSLDIELYD